MSGRTSYMCMSVRGAIRDLQGKRANAKTYMNDDDGKPLSRDGAINALMDELAKGREVIPMHSKCGNPCKQNHTCTGFDFKDGGCPGYMVIDGVPA